MPDEQHFRKLERMYAGAPTNEYYLPTLEVRRGAAEITIEVRKEFFHAADAVHGSVYFKALDDAAWFAANSLVSDVCLLTSSFNLYLVRPVAAGRLRSVGRVVHESKRLFIAEAELTGTDGRLLARGSGTFMRSDIPLSPEIGYR